MKCRIATRGSKLALWQAQHVAARLQKHGMASELVVVKTEGDKVQDRFLHEIGGKGLFVKELEQALIEKKADLAVHSLKDMPAKIPSPFVLTAILKRHTVADALIFGDRLARQELPEKITSTDLARFGAKTIGTASLRRQSLIKKYAPNIEVTGVRGNVDTRIAKLAAGSWDMLILAQASLERLDICDITYRTMQPEDFIPCAAQGALAVECLADSSFTEVISRLDHPKTRQCVTIERRILEDLGGDCTMPFGCWARIESEKDILSVDAIILDPQGRSVFANYAGSASDDIESVVRHLTDRLWAAGAKEILQRLGITTR